MLCLPVTSFRSITVLLACGLSARDQVLCLPVTLLRSITALPSWWFVGS
jgi:hypothetical protein